MRFRNLEPRRRLIFRVRFKWIQTFLVGGWVYRRTSLALLANWDALINADFLVEFQETESRQRRLKLAGYSRKCINERANSGGLAGVRVLSALVRTVIETWDYRVPLRIRKRFPSREISTLILWSNNWKMNRYRNYSNSFNEYSMSRGLLRLYVTFKSRTDVNFFETRCLRYRKSILAWWASDHRASHIRKKSENRGNIISQNFQKGVEISKILQQGMMRESCEGLAQSEEGEIARGLLKFFASRREWNRVFFAREREKSWLPSNMILLSS